MGHEDQPSLSFSTYFNSSNCVQATSILLSPWVTNEVCKEISLAHLTHLRCLLPGELYILIVQSVPSPSLINMFGVSSELGSLKDFLAHLGFAGGIIKPEQKSPTGTE